MITNSVFGLRRSYKALPKSQICTERRSWSLFGDLPSIWSTTAFWIPEKRLHLRSMLCKLTRYTENCNACSQHWSTKRAQLCKMTMLCYTSPPTTLQKLNELGYEVLPRPPYSTSSLVTAHPLLEASWQLFPGKLPPQPARGKVLSKALLVVESWSTICMLQKFIYLLLTKMF